MIPESAGGGSAVKSAAMGFGWEQGEIEGFWGRGEKEKNGRNTTFLKQITDIQKARGPAGGTGAPK